MGMIIQNQSIKSPEVAEPEAAEAAEALRLILEAVEQAVDAIEASLQNTLDREVSSMQIGELAMEQLKKLDEVAYVRFASVYRQFRDINTFMDELSKLLSDKK